MGELGLIATFPMLEDARVWLREEGPPMERLLTDIAYNRARDRARMHVRDALEGTPPDPRSPSGEVEAEMALLARPLARLLVAAVGEEYLVSRYAVWEAKRASSALERAPSSLVVAVAESLSVPVRKREDENGEAVYALRFEEYLVRAPNEKAWHLVRRDPDQGMVALGQEAFARLLEEVYRLRLAEELQERVKQVPGIVREAFGGEVEHLQERVKERLARRKEEGFTQVEPGVFPPCMKRILKDMHEHINVPHMGRFAIVTFLHKLDMDTEDILEFFSSVPDFDPEKSRYQIEHITGKGSPEAYTPPGCATMQSYGVCPLQDRDSLCMKIKHPLSYYRRALWREKKRKEEQGEQEGEGQESTDEESQAAAKDHAVASATGNTNAGGDSG